MSHFYTVSERTLLRMFDKTEKDVLIREGKFLARKIREEQKKQNKITATS